MHLAVALNFTQKEGVSLPDEIDLLPPGQTVAGIDGRSWKNPGNDKIIDFFKSRGTQLPVDINHSTEIKAHSGDPSPAQGWITDIYESGGGLKGKVAWNASAESEVGGGRYKYISPAFVYDKQGIIRGIKSAGLVNHPNLSELAALNSESSGLDEGGSMKKIAEALGLPEDATEDQILTAMNAMKEKNKVALNMADYIPRADYQLALNRAETAEQKLKTREEEEFKTALNSELDKGVESGKIAPASRSFYEKTVTTAEGLEEFKKFVDGAPTVVATNNENLDKKPSGDQVALNAEEEALAVQLGYSKEEAIKVFRS